MESYKKKMEQASIKLEDTKPSKPATTASKPKELPLGENKRLWVLLEERNKRSFVSLIHQIGEGMEKGYKERGIIDAVIRSINPSLRLRSYLKAIKAPFVPVVDKQTSISRLNINFSLDLGFTDR